MSSKKNKETKQAAKPAQPTPGKIAGGAIDADVEYIVRFRVPHDDGRLRYRPMTNYYMPGETLKKLPDDKILSSQKA